MVRNFTLLFCVLFQFQATALSATSGANFSKFSSLSDAVIDKISAAKQRVWLASEFMSDFDIALALYLAKFRKLDVRVMLSDARVNGFLSQYDYLLDNGVSIRTAADTGVGTHLLCDNKLISIDSDLNFLSDRKSFAWQEVKQKATNHRMIAMFKHAFDSALDRGLDSYDYSRKVHRRPSDIAHKLPKRTIADKKKSTQGKKRL